MMAGFALIAGISLSLLPISVLVRRVVARGTPDVENFPPLPAGSLDRGGWR